MNRPSLTQSQNQLNNRKTTQSIIPGKTSKFSIILSIILAFIIFENISSILSYKQSYNRLKESQIQLKQLEDENSEWRAKIDEAQGEEYLEKFALEELNLTKDNKIVVVLDNSLKPNRQNSSKDETAENKGDLDANKLSNLQKWLKAFNFIP